MTLFDTVAKLNQRIRQQLEALWESYEEEEISWDEFVDVGSNLIAAAAQRARAIGDLSVAAQLTKLRKTIEVSTGISVPEDLKEQAAAALNEQRETQSFQIGPAESMGVAGAAVVMSTMQDSITTGMEEREIYYYTRAINPDACEICSEMDGKKFHVSVEFWHHKGCQCMPTILIGDN